MGLRANQGESEGVVILFCFSIHIHSGVFFTTWGARSAVIATVDPRKLAIQGQMMKAMMLKNDENGENDSDIESGCNGESGHGGSGVKGFESTGNQICGGSGEVFFRSESVRDERWSFWTNWWSWYCGRGGGDHNQFLEEFVGEWRRFIIAEVIAYLELDMWDDRMEIFSWCELGCLVVEAEIKA